MSKHWIAAWGCPIAKPTRYVAEWIKDTTVRMNLYMTVSGSALRLHFSNLFGKQQATITRASVAICQQESDVEADSIRTVTFDGRETVTMEAAGGVCSDEIPLEFKAGQTITVSLYFGEFVQMTTAHSNTGVFIEKWIAEGDCTHMAQLPVNDNMSADAYPFIHTVDALCDENCYSIVAFGDSITAQTWPDRFARRLTELGIEHVAVVRKAISGSRVLREFPCTMYSSYGPKGLDRFEREVIQAGVKKVFILHGINDIIHPDGSFFRPMSHQPTPEQLIAGLQYYIDVAHAHGIEVYMSPILPFKGWHTFCEEKNDIRLAVNDWIRNRANIEGIIPFDEAVQDPDDPQRMLDICSSEDHLHPRSVGAQRMAESIPVEWL